MSVQTTTPQELDRLRTTGKAIEILDVRTPVEYRELHADSARNVPLDRLDPAAVMQAHGGSREEPIYLICRSGSRGRQACEKFQAAGFANVINVEGGTLAWAEAGLPVVRGKKAISLERQVRIAAGSLVLLGVGLGLLHPVFLALAAFIGAGLVFAGYDGHLRHGPAAGPHALEPRRGNAPASCCAGKPDAATRKESKP